VAYTYRMPAGFAGDVNRTHPAAVEPALTCVATPPTKYGQIVVVDTATNSVRPLAAGDQSDATLLTPWGVTVRPFPTQQTAGGMTSTIGAATPPVTGGIDVLRSGYIMGQLNANVAAATKGGTVYVWCAATSGDHVQGGYETAFSAGNTVTLDARYKYNGPADSTGIVEISANV